MRNRLPSGHGWAYLGVALGLIASVAGNVANTVLTDSRVPLELRIPFAVIWPVFLGIGIEVLTRIDWKAGWKHWSARALLIGPMSLVSGFMSYLHLHHLMVMSGEPGLAQAVGPLAVDGTLFGCTVALLVTRTKARNVEDVPRVSLAQRVAAARQTALDLKAAATTPAALEPAPAPVLKDPAAAMVHHAEVLEEVLADTEDPTPEVLEDFRDRLDRAAKSPEVQKLAAEFQQNEARIARTQRGSIDYAKVLRAVQEIPKDQDVADTIGGSAKTAQRVRRAARLLDTTTDLKAIASTVKLPLAAVQTIAAELKTR